MKFLGNAVLKKDDFLQFRNLLYNENMELYYIPFNNPLLWEQQVKR